MPEHVVSPLIKSSLNHSIVNIGRKNDGTVQFSKDLISKFLILVKL